MLNKICLSESESESEFELKGDNVSSSGVTKNQTQTPWGIYSSADWMLTHKLTGI